jgi:hypothetical protein
MSQLAATVLKRERRWLRGAVVACGLVDFYTTRYAVLSDGISYLEIAERYREGAWHAAVNSYWSPLYSWLLALALLGVRPGSYFEIVALHLVNLGALLTSLAAFEFLVCELGLLDPTTHSHQQRRLAMVVAYALFLWGAIGLIGCGFVAPDLITTVWVYLLTAFLLRFLKRPPRVVDEIVFGAVVALAYFTKTAMLPIGLVYLVAGSWAAKRLRVALVSGCACVIIIAPWGWALRADTGLWTFGESGKLNYAWEVLDARRYTHWQGEGANVGRPRHPTRRVSTNPEIYEFAEPIRSTYPPWYAPAYWYDGIDPQFALRPQVAALAWNSRYAAFLCVVGPGFLVGLILVYRARLFGRVIKHAKIMVVLVPALAAIALYCVVFVDRRYVAAQLVLVNICVLYGWTRNQQLVPRSHVTLLKLNVILSCAWYFLIYIALGVVLLCMDIASRRETFPNLAWYIAREMEDVGLRRGDAIAYLGLPIHAYWARLSGVRIIAEVPMSYDRREWLSRGGKLVCPELKTFWHSNAEAQGQVFDKFARAGARYVVADIVPAWADLEGWYRLTTKSSRVTREHEIYVRALGPQPLRMPMGAHESRVPPWADQAPSERCYDAVSQSTMRPLFSAPHDAFVMIRWWLPGGMFLRG